MANWQEQWRHLSARMRRRKAISAHDHSTELRRCLTTSHLTFMGVGSTVGVGIYVLVGVAAKEYAGPGVLLSFLLAGVVTMFNAVSFAEFGARIPKTGAFYTYVYESTFELLAFIVGWITLIGYLTSGAIAARAWSGYLDSIFNNYIHTTTTELIGDVTLGAPFSENLDFMACGYEIVVIVIISSGVHASAFISSILAGVSVAVLVFVSVMGLALGDYGNIANTEHGGFLPFGIGGVLAGTAACFYAYQGFDIICMSAEECKTPSKSIPRAIAWELLIVTVLYIGSSFGMILLVPYLDINTRAPLPSAFAYRGIQWAKLVVSIGPTLGISNLNILNLYSLSRHVYCMSSDGLFFKTFLTVHPKTQVPVRATVALGLVVAVFALFLDISNLVSFNVIAIFFGFIVTNTILIMSRKKEDSQKSPPGNGSIFERSSARTNVAGKSKSGLEHLADHVELNNLLYLVIFTSVGLGIQLTKGMDDLHKGMALAWTCVGVLVGLLVLLSVLISKKTGPATHKGFSMSFVPYLPVLSIVVNITLLIAAVDVAGIVAYGILVVLGFALYIGLVSCDSRPSSTLTTADDTVERRPIGIGFEEMALLTADDSNDDDEEDMFS